MKKPLALLLALAILLGILPAGMTVPVQAAGPAYGSVPILCGDPETDLMADRILASIDFSEMNERERIQAVYDWVILNCTRVWDMSTVEWMPGPEPEEVAAYSEQMLHRLSSGQALLRANLCTIYTDYTRGEEEGTVNPSRFDSNRSVQTHGYDTVHTYAGDCVDFSAMFALLLGHLGYDARLVSGYFLGKNGPNSHTWNLVLIGDRYYWFDIRIDDGNATETSIPHKYFMKDDTDEWAKKHIWARGYTDLLEANVAPIKTLYAESGSHTHTWKTTSAECTAACEQTGWWVETCSVCKLRHVSYLALGHDWTLLSDVGPTCTEDGQKRYLCKRCAAVREEAVPARGHEWKTDQILTPAEDGEHGTARYLCGVCGEEKTAKLCASELYTDAPKEKNWAHRGVDFCVFRGLMVGTSATTFSPEATLNRAMVVQILWASEGKPAPAQACSFRDVRRGAWYAKAVAWAEEAGLVSGVGDGRFAPEQAITRQELAVLLRGFAAYKGVSTEEEADLSVYPDRKAVSKWAKPAMRWAVAVGILSGTTGSNHTVLLAPKQGVTRAMAAVMFMRLLTNLEKAS